MNTVAQPDPTGRLLQREVMRFSFGWLVAANIVGVWLALILLFPDWGKVLHAVTYGRLMPLHMDWQLYGWCSLPLLGLLMKVFLSSSIDRIANARFILVVWSLGLLAGGADFIAGDASGKLFLSFNGLSRAFFPLALLLIWSVLATCWLRDQQEKRLSGWWRIITGLLLAAIATVPFALYFATSRSVYPPVDPDSGGATGHSLLASSLGILGLFGGFPLLIRIERKENPVFWIFWVMYAASWLGYLGIHHGSVANTQIDQIVGLGLLVILIPALVAYYLTWKWPTGMAPWVWAFLAWWALLTLDGWITFLPGFLDRLKFTNALVAHAHLAMAGMVTAFNFIVLALLERDNAFNRQRIFGGQWPFLVWNGAVLVLVTVLLWQGWREGGDPGVLFGRDSLTFSLYAVRALAGIALLSASIAWLRYSLIGDKEKGT